MLTHLLASAAALARRQLTKWTTFLGCHALAGKLLLMADTDTKFALGIAGAVRVMRNRRQSRVTLAVYADYLPEAEPVNRLPEPVAAGPKVVQLFG